MKLTKLILIQVIFISTLINAQEKSYNHMFIINNTFAKSKVGNIFTNNYSFESKLAVSGEIGYGLEKKINPHFGIETGIVFGALIRRWDIELSGELDIFGAGIMDIENYNLYTKIPLSFSYRFHLNNNFSFKGTFGPHFIAFADISSSSIISFRVENASYNIITINECLFSQFKTGYHLKFDLLHEFTKNKFIVYGINFNGGLGKKTQIIAFYNNEGTIAVVDVTKNNWYIGFNLGYLF